MSDDKRVPIVLYGYHCERCGHDWVPRSNRATPTPKVCPKCKSPYWDRSRNAKVEERAGLYFDEEIAPSLHRSGTPSDAIEFLRGQHIDGVRNSPAARRQLREWAKGRA